MDGILVSSDDARPAAIRIQLHLDAIPHQHFDAVQTHFPGEVREYQGFVGELYPEERIRKRLFDDSFYYLWFCHMICAEKITKIGLAVKDLPRLGSRRLYIDADIRRIFGE